MLIEELAASNLIFAHVLGGPLQSTRSMRLKTFGQVHHPTRCTSAKASARKSAWAVCTEILCEDLQRLSTAIETTKIHNRLKKQLGHLRRKGALQLDLKLSILIVSWQTKPMHARTNVKCQGKCMLHKHANTSGLYHSPSSSVAQYSK
jgi:hypothetical protein